MKKPDLKDYDLIEEIDGCRGCIFNETEVCYTEDNYIGELTCGDREAIYVERKKIIKHNRVKLKLGL